jgi:hypothetical protein
MSEQRRGKIARLPRDIRDQLNIRLDDGHEADQILPWLNELPQVRQVLAQHFNGAAISAQNLSAWRQGGFQEWLLHQEFLDSAERACENALELNDVLNADASNALPRAMADSLVTHLTARLAAFMSRWDGATVSPEMGTLVKFGQFIIKLQQAIYRAEQQAIELPQLKRQTERKEEQHRKIDEAYKDYCATMTRIREANKSAALEKAKNTVPRKPPVRSARPKAKSNSIKVDKGSRGNQAEPPDSGS